MKLHLLELKYSGVARQDGRTVVISASCLGVENMSLAFTVAFSYPRSEFLAFGDGIAKRAPKDEGSQ